MEFRPEAIRIEPMGEFAYILRNLGDVPAHFLAQALSKDDRILEATPSYETVGVYVGPDFNPDALPKILASVHIEADLSVKTHEIPVCYALGPDLQDVANQLGLDLTGVVHAHSSAVYTCYAVGFQPGFPFLGYLPESLQGLPRRQSPRTKVPSGSVGITGKQTGIYPSETPGGWNLIGRTPLCIASLEDGYFPISAGDEVRFVSIDEREFERRNGERL